MPQNDFLPFADGGGANVISQSAYAGLSNLATGFASGIAPSNVANKVWRQGSLWAYFVSQFVVNETGQNVLDNGDIITPLTNLTNAIGIAAKAAVSARVPQQVTLTSGSGTYTTPVGAISLEVEMVGGGSGGGGSGISTGTAGGASTAGSATTFGSSLLTANGGPVAPASATSTVPTAATATGGDINIAGGLGLLPSEISSQNSLGVVGAGASTPFGSGGSGGGSVVISSVISAIAAQTPAAYGAGGGPGGAGNAATITGGFNPGWSGNAGAYIKKLITSPLATYAYAVGAGGGGGTAGTNGQAGAGGAGGVIRIIARFQ